MTPFESARSEYWDARYRNARFPYGETPSRSAELAIEDVRRRGARTTLVPGCGSGRHVLAFARAGLEVSAFDCSPVAIAIAREALDREGLRARLDVRDLLVDPGRHAITYDAVFAYGVTQLFSADERPIVVATLSRHVNATGVVVWTAFSRSDPAFGQGEEVEPATYRDSRHRTAHFFTRQEIEALVPACFSLARLEEIEEPGAPRTDSDHVLFYVVLERAPS